MAERTYLILVDATVSSEQDAHLKKYLLSLTGRMFMDCKIAGLQVRVRALTSDSILKDAGRDI